MSSKIININDSVKWIGIRDFDIKTFDIVMETEYGTTYNSYFIDADKKAIVETAKEKFSEEYLEKIKTVVEPEKIDYILLNHTEPDHSGSLKKLIDIAPNATVVASAAAIKYLKDMHDVDFKFQIVKDGDEIDLGNKTLKIIGASNLHWPDSIYTYMPEDKMLFTCDSFGAHYCSDEMFDDLINKEEYDDAFKYYFDVILKPYSRFLIRAIDKIKSLDIDVIAPGHGPILRSNHKGIVELSAKLSQEYMDKNEHSKKKVLITYVSAYGYTKEMAKALAEGIEMSGAEVDAEVLDIEKIDIGELDSKIVLADALLVGSPTINQNILLPVYKMFAVINPIRDRGKLAASFGSFGWSGEGVGIIAANLKELKLKVIDSPEAMKFRPDSNQKEILVNFGKEFAKKLIK